MGSHSLLQGIFPTQGLNPSLLHCKQIFYPLSHQGSLDAYKESLGAVVSKIETSTKHSPTPLEGHMGGQGKQGLGLGRTEQRL